MRLSPGMYAEKRKVYEGRLVDDKQTVFVDGCILEMATSAKYRSVVMGWGFRDPRSGQLAFTLLADAFGPDMGDLVAGLLQPEIHALPAHESWTLTTDDLYAKVMASPDPLGPPKKKRFEEVVAPLLRPVREHATA